MSASVSQLGRDTIQWRPVKALLYENRAWREQSGKQLNCGHASPAARRQTPARLMLGGTHDNYTKALQLSKRKGLAADSLGMPYLKHAKPIERDSFPAHWWKAAHQAYFSDQLPESPRLLICFAGIARTLNMPIPCFHSIAAHLFDGIAYFFDERRDFYRSTQCQVEQAVDALMLMAPWAGVALLGASGGASVALRFSGHALIGRRLSASPSIMRDPHVMGLIEQGEFAIFNNSRIFHAHQNKLDSRHYEYLRDRLPADLFKQCVFDLSHYSPSHGTLATLLRMDALSDELAWLRGGQAAP